MEGWTGLRELPALDQRQHPVEYGTAGNRYERGYAGLHLGRRRYRISLAEER